MEKRKAAGDSMARTLELLVDQLPPDLWIDSVDLQYADASGPDRDKIAKAPKVVVTGAGKSLGTSHIDEVYKKFITDVQALPAGAEAKPADLVYTQTPGREKFVFQLELSYLNGAH